MLELWAADLRRGGRNLSPSAQAELATINDRIVDIGVAFQQEVAEWDETIELAEGDLAGLSPLFVERLPPAERPGSRRLSIKYADVFPFLEQSDRRDLRHEVLRRYLSQAAAANRPRLDELIGLRRRAASLLGRPSWAHAVIADRMAGSPEAVNAFLDTIVEPLRQLARRELVDMATLLDAPVVEASDIDWCHERRRRAVGIDSGELAAYFPLESVLGGLFDLAREVFGVEVRPVPDASVWHPDVRVIDLHDAVTSTLLATVYLDLFPRDGKEPGGFASQLTWPETSTAGDRTPATVVLVLNQTPPAHGRDALLTHDDLAALFHEFGHVLEFGLGRYEIAPMNWEWSERDFVEGPSQIMEHWAWEPAILARFARHHETGEPAPSEALEALATTRSLDVGVLTLWTLVYRTLLDLDLHGPEPPDPAVADRKAMAVTLLPFLEGTFKPASFVHIVGGYDAGFYGYLWAQVYGDDMFSRFREAGLTSSEVGLAYRREILEQSWSRHPAESLRAFLGRDPSPEAFLRRLGIAVPA